MVLIDKAINDPENGFDSIAAPLREAYSRLDSVMTFIAGGKCNLGKLALTEGQQEYLKFVFDQFAQGEEIEAGKPIPAVISPV